MTTKANNSKYIVASEDGTWHYSPVEAIDGVEAVKKSDSDWEASEGTEYFVYELVNSKPLILRAKKSLVEV